MIWKYYSITESRIVPVCKNVTAYLYSLLLYSSKKTEEKIKDKFD